MTSTIKMNLTNNSIILWIKFTRIFILIISLLIRVLISINNVFLFKNHILIFFVI